MDAMNVPHAVRLHADDVVAVTDAVCREHLDVDERAGRRSTR